MVKRQICTPEHLRNSGYGRPFPRHGLQLLFWFANQCVTCELVNFVIIMKLVPDCQPERGSYGFHWFGNAEELLPVLTRPRKSNNKKQAMYFEVGNLNTETYQDSANLPKYVRENHDLEGNRGTYNIDRIIISYQVRTKVIETVYVTEHDRASPGRFSPDRTYEISSELIKALQNSLLDLNTFLTQMGYYRCIPDFLGNAIQEIHYPGPSAQDMLNMVQTYRESTARTEHSIDVQFFSDAFHQQADVSIVPLNYDQHVRYTANVNPYNSRFMALYNVVPDNYRRHGYWPCRWNQLYEGFDEEAKKRNGGGGGFSFVKLLLGAGVFCLAVKCFSWLRSWWKASSYEYIVKGIPWKPPSYKHTHIMLDYVY